MATHSDRYFIGSLVPGVHPSLRPTTVSNLMFENFYVYLISWCLIQNISVEKAWLHDLSSNFIIKVKEDSVQAAKNALGQHANETTLQSWPDGLPKGSSCSFYRCTLPESSFRKTKFFLRGWSPSLSRTTAAKTENEKRHAVSSAGVIFRTVYGYFARHPPPPVKLTTTPGIDAQWYEPLQSPSPSTATSAPAPANPQAVAAHVTTAPTVIGDNHKRSADGSFTDSPRPSKRFKADDPETSDRMEGVEPSVSMEDRMDVDSDHRNVGDGMEGIEVTFRRDDEMDVDPDGLDGLHRRIRQLHPFGVPDYEFIGQRITYLS